MKGSVKGPIPDVLSQWWATNGADPPPPWKELQNPEKQQILIALLVEQHYVCVYCGKSIDADPHNSHIEHFWPQANFENMRFSWANLFASCGPTGRKKTPKTCGDAKGGWVPANHIEPTDPQCESKFAYDGNGAISTSNIGGQRAEEMIAKLRLDDATLDYERFLIVAELEERILDGEIAISSVAEEINLWRNLGSDGKLRAFGHVAARYLEVELLA